MLIEMGKYYTDSYYLVNYQINGKEIKNYNALKQEVYKDIWEINRESVGDESLPFDIITTKIAYVLKGAEQYDDEIKTQMSFQDNILTIVLNNDNKDRISLLHKDGFWVVLD